LREEAERRAKDAEDAMGKLQAEVAEYRRVSSLKDAEIAE
jgi:hypothetical protein